MHKSKYVILIIMVFLSAINYISCHTFSSQATEPKHFRYFKILASTYDDSVFIQVQEEMEIHPKESNYVLIINVLNDNPSKHYVVFGFETDATSVRANFYTLSKKTRDKLLEWNMENTTDLQNPIYYVDNQWSKKETSQQREDRLIKQVEEYSKEISNFKKALELAPSNAEIIGKIENSYCRRASVYEDVEEYSKAISDYTEAIEINPKNSSTLSHRGYLYFRIKDYSNAIYDFTKSMEYNPSDKYLSFNIVECFYNRADIYYDAKEFTKALYDYKKVIELDSIQQLYRHDDINNSCGLTYIGNKEYSKAISIYDKILENNPHYSLAYLYRGIAYCENKNLAKGCDDLKRASILGIPDAKKMLGKYCK